mgnify:CR=1 FL=1
MGRINTDLRLRSVRQQKTPVRIGRGHPRCVTNHNTPSPPDSDRPKIFFRSTVSWTAAHPGIDCRWQEAARKRFMFNSIAYLSRKSLVCPLRAIVAIWKILRKSDRSKKRYPSPNFPCFSIHRRTTAPAKVDRQKIGTADAASLQDQSRADITNCKTYQNNSAIAANRLNDAATYCSVL